MKHQNKNKKFNRDTNQRKALFKSLVVSLIRDEEIKTTLAKAKILKKMADSILSRAQKGSLAVRRQIYAFLSNKKIVNKLIDDVAPRFEKIGGGFTRLTRIGSWTGLMTSGKRHPANGLSSCVVCGAGT